LQPRACDAGVANDHALAGICSGLQLDSRCDFACDPAFESFNERLAKEGFFYLPNAAKQRIFKTSSGKAKLTVCPIPKHDLKPDEFLLTTIRTHDQFNSTIYGLDDRAMCCCSF